MRTASSLPCLLIALFSAGCGGGGSAYNSKTTAPMITTQPADASVAVGNTATFSVVASGTAPLSYQWQRNRAAIMGATA